MPHDTTETVEIGQQIGPHYTVERFVAGGGMGQVWVARDALLDRRVALKLLHPDKVDEVAVGRFEREARTLSRVVHPNVVAVHGFGRHEGAWYLVMEYVAGQSLDAALRSRGAFAVDETVALVRQVASGLAEAHALGLIHRDIKPGNVLLRRVASGATVAKVVDFGLARDYGGVVDNAVTRREGMLGTPAYMSPEQIQSQPLDERADLYSLAVMTYQMLSGRLPLFRDTMQGQLIAHLIDTPAPLAGEGDDPRLARVEKVLLQALSKERDQRQEGVMAFAEALATAAGHDVSGQRAEQVRCETCGYEHAEAGGYCGRCGAAVPLKACATCGAVREGERYWCGGCGGSLLALQRAVHRAEPGRRALDRVTAAALVVRLAGLHDETLRHVDVPELFSAIVEREGGRPLAFLGDELAALFGLGGMREHETEAAADAALALRQTLARALDGTGAQLSLGIESGLVGTRGVGVAWGTAWAGGAGLEGARMVAKAAADGEIAVGPGAARALRGPFDLHEPAEGQALLTRRHDRDRSFANTEVRGVRVPLVGRDLEVATLKRAAQRVRMRGELRVVSLIGAAGMGKSRLVGEQVRALDDTRWQLHVTRCTTVPMPYEPFVHVLRGQLDPAARNPAEALAQLPGIASGGLQTTRRVASLTRLMGLSGEDDTPTRPTGDAEQRAAFDAYGAWLRAIALERPVLLAIEDLQWASGPTRALLRHLCDTCADLPILLLLTLRPERAAELLDALELPAAASTTLELAALEADESRALIAHLLDGLSLPAALEAGLHDFASGVPVRVQEAVDALIEDRVVVRSADGYRFDARRAAEQVSLDRSLVDMVLRRVGRLPPAERGLLQAVAVAGHDAPAGLLAAMLERPLSNRELDGAVASGFLVEVPHPAFEGERELRIPDLQLAEIVADAAPPPVRRSLHRRAASWLLEWQGPRPAGFGGLLAGHFLVAGDRDDAVPYLLQSARDAVRAFANRDAFDAYSAAAEVARDLEEQAPAAAGGRLDALVGKAEVALRLGEHDALRQCVAEAETLARALDRPQDLARALVALGNGEKDRGAFDAALDALTRAVDAAGPTSGVGVYALSLRAMTLQRAGRAEEAAEVARATLAVLAAEGEPTRVDLDRVAAEGRLRTTLGQLASRAGDFDEARAHLEQAAACFERIDDPVAAAMTRLSAGNVAYRAGDLAVAEQVYREVVAACEAVDYPRGAVMAGTNLGNALLDQQQLREARSALDAAERSARQIRMRGSLPEILRLRGAVLLKQGDLGGAKRVAEEAVRLARAMGHDTLVAAGEVLLQDITVSNAQLTATTQVLELHDEP